MPFTAIPLVRAQLKRDHAVLVECADEFVVQCRRNFARAPGGEEKIVLRGEFAVDSPWWLSALNKAVSAIEAEHRNLPTDSGLALMRLAILFPKVLAQVFDALVADLAARRRTNWRCR